RRREFIALLGSATVSLPCAARGQQSQRIYRIGSLAAGAPVPQLLHVFPKALRDLGWIEGKNVTIERRYAEDRLDRLPALVAELIGMKVDVIVAGGSLAPLAAKRATSTIPIVMSNAGDPLGSGLVTNLLEATSPG